MRYRISQCPGMNAGITCCTGKQENMQVWGRSPFVLDSVRFNNVAGIEQYIRAAGSVSRADGRTGKGRVL